MEAVEEDFISLNLYDSVEAVEVALLQPNQVWLFMPVEGMEAPLITT